LSEYLHLLGLLRNVKSAAETGQETSRDVVTPQMIIATIPS